MNERWLPSDDGRYSASRASWLIRGRNCVFLWAVSTVNSDEDGLPLGVELERLALREVAADYDDLNYQLFGNRLVRPPLAWSDARHTLGAWMGQPPNISLSRALLTMHPWSTLLEVLKHEMAHQFVCEVLQLHHEPPHGPTFTRVCQERGIDPRAAGNAPERPDAPDHALDKIRRLLALAESSNQHEAQAAMAAAQRLMLKHNLDQVSRNDRRQFVVKHFGVPTGRVQESQRLLTGILRDFFFVETIWVSVWRPRVAKRGSVLEVCGTLSNVEMAEYVYAFLMHSAERLWVEHQRKLGIRHNRERRSFIAGVMSGFYKKLRNEREPQRAEGLVWLGDSQLRNHFRARHPKTRMVSYGTSHGTAAHARGQQAGQRLILHRGIGHGPSSSGKLLGS